MNRSFQLVDVFGKGALTGNPVAVVFDADDLTPAEMQKMTQWLNLSEATFLHRPATPGADYRVRIFSPSQELPFAGHPTLGTCHAWLIKGGRPAEASQVVQECGVGLITIRRTAEMLSFAAPALIREGPVDESTLAEFAAFLRINRSDIVDAQWADNGPGWVVVLLASAEAVLALEPMRDYLRHIDVGVVGPHPAGHSTAFELRAFFTDQQGNVREDPVTGSLNASTAQWLLSSGRATAPYVASQGARVGRSGHIYIHQDGSGLWVGGRTATLFSGICTV